MSCSISFFSQFLLCYLGSTHETRRRMVLLVHSSQNSRVSTVMVCGIHSHRAIFFLQRLSLLRKLLLSWQRVFGYGSFYSPKSTVFTLLLIIFWRVSKSTSTEHEKTGTRLRRESLSVKLVHFKVEICYHDAMVVIFFCGCQTAEQQAIPVRDATRIAPSNSFYLCGLLATTDEN